MYSTAPDLVNFYQMMLDKGRFHGKRLLSPASVEFSIYVRDVVDKVREEQPVRIYERK